MTLLETNACSPLATNAHRAATSGTTSPRSPTRTCPRSARSRSTTRSPASRGSTRCPAAAAATRGRRRWSACGRRRPSCSTTRSGRSNRSRRSRRGWPSFEDSIEKMLWPEKRERDPVLGDKVPGAHRPSSTHHRAATSGCRRAICRELPATLTRLARAGWLPAILGERRHRDRADPQGHAGQPAGEHRPLPEDADCRQRSLQPSAADADQARPQGAAARTPATRRRARSSRNAGARRCSSSASAPTSWSTAATTSAPTLPPGGAGAERRRQAGADRVPEDVLSRRTTRMATPDPTASADCEYVVVGSGAGGGTLAARLAEDGHKRPAARSGRRSAQLHGGDPARAGREPPARRLRRPGLPRLRLGERRR